jgi:hypothetical protein
LNGSFWYRYFHFGNRSSRCSSPTGSSSWSIYRLRLTEHLKAAVAMADSQLRHGSDPRLRIMAHAIRHEQQGEIALMHAQTANSLSLSPFETCSPTM